MTIQAIIDHNNMAVALMEQRSIKPAIDNTVKALQIQREQLIEAVSIQNDEFDSIDACMLFTEVTSNTYLVNHNNRMLIYGQGISIPDSFTNSAMISAIVLFNLALAHHLGAISEKPSSGLLAKAKQLYQLTFEVHAHAEGDVLFPFAVINNLAVIEHMLGNTAESMWYFGLLGAKTRSGVLNEEEHS